MMVADVSRRTFIKTATVTAGGIAAAGTLAFKSATALADDASQITETTGSVGGEFMNAAKASGKWEFEIAPEAIRDDEIADTIQADIVVVGAGAAGMCTAVSAAESGLSVAVICAGEKTSARGGSNNAVYCKAMERDGVPKVGPSMFEKEIFCSVNKVDAKKWYRHYNNSEEAANWAIDLMEGAGYKVTVEYGTPMNEDNLYYQATAAIGWAYGDGMEEDPSLPQTTGMMQPLFLGCLQKRFEELGGTIDFLTVGKQLTRDGVPNGTSGRVDGVIAQRADGTYARYSAAKAVVLATGDFSADRDMMARYCPEAAGLISDDVYDGEAKYDIGFQYGGLMKGDGQKMGLWAGAAWQKHTPNCPMIYPTLPGPGVLYGNHWGLMVNRDGERFMNEYCLAPMAGRTIQEQPGGVVCAIWDSAYPSHVRTTGTWNNDSAYSGDYGTTDQSEIQATLDAWDEKVKSGDYVKADTLEELIGMLELPESTIDVIDGYNDMAKAGEDTEYYKNSSVLFPIEEGPFYGQRCEISLGFLTVLGGLRTNSYNQVCDENDDPLPGLYNVGSMTGDMYHGTYTFQIEGANYGMCCLTFGYLTGKYIAENE